MSDAPPIGDVTGPRGPGPEAALLLLVAALALRGPTTWPEGGLLADGALLLALALAARCGRLRVPAGAPLALAGVLLVVSAATAPDAGAAIDGLRHALRLLAGFWSGCSVATRRASATAWGLTALGALGAGHAALQVHLLHPALAASHPELPAVELAQLTDGRANSIFVLPAHFGAFEAVALVAAAGLGAVSRGRHRLAAIVLASASLGGIVLSGSFGALLLACVGGAVLALVLAPPRWRLGLVAAGALAATALAGLALARRGAEIRRESPWAARAGNWATAAALIREEPLVGHGPGSFGVEHARLRPPASNDVRHAHEAYLEAASDAGLGLLTLLAAFLGAFAARLAAWARRGTRADAGILAGATVALAAGLIDFGWSLAEWGVPAAIVLGTAWTASDEEISLAPAVPRRVLLAAAIAVAAAVLLTDGATAVAGVAAERGLDAASRGEHAEAQRLLRGAARATPWDDARWADLAGADLALAELERDPAARGARLAEAELAARRAIEASPRKAARHALLARVLTALGDAPAAAAAARRAADLAPHARSAAP